METAFLLSKSLLVSTVESVDFQQVSTVEKTIYLNYFFITTSYANTTKTYCFSFDIHIYTLI